MKKKLNKNSFITAICAFLIVVTTFTSFTALATTKIGYATLKAYTVTSTIGDVTKSYSDRYSSIFVNRSSSDSNFEADFWVKDITNKKVLTNRKAIKCTATRTGYLLPYTSTATFSTGDTLRFYGSQASSTSKGIDYTIYSDKAVL